MDEVTAVDESVGDDAESERLFLAGELGKAPDQDSLDDSEDTSSVDPKAEAQEDEPVEEEPEEELVHEGPAIKEAKRLREKNRELKARLEALEAKETAKPPAPSEAKPQTMQERLVAASTEELVQTELELDERLYAARQEGDTELAKQLAGYKKAIKLELNERPSQAMQKREKISQAQSQWQSVEDKIAKAVPDVKDPDSKLMKQVKAFAETNSALMEQLGDHLGGIVALATIIATSPTTTTKEKKAVSSLVQDMESIASTTTSKSGNSVVPNGKVVNVAALSDEEFEKMGNRIKNGELSFAALG